MRTAGSKPEGPRFEAQRVESEEWAEIEFGAFWPFKKSHHHHFFNNTVDKTQP